MAGRIFYTRRKKRLVWWEILPNHTIYTADGDISCSLYLPFSTGTIACVLPCCTGWSSVRRRPDGTPSPIASRRMSRGISGTSGTRSLWPSRKRVNKSFLWIFFWRARVCRPLLRLCRPFMIFEECLVRTQSTAVLSWRATDLATHPSKI